ncbi:MAG: DUF3604 domain-containing protein [Proteobacteria bacterium]|nr:DUF3604 domain-containing protein [Pseudomonadota bacterium]
MSNRILKYLMTGFAFAGLAICPSLLAQDFGIDPEKADAYYNVRVTEISSPRWTAYDVVFFDVEMPRGTKMTVQDRAYTSPIWYTP